jgi:hypothetical protein
MHFVSSDGDSSTAIPDFQAPFLPGMHRALYGYGKIIIRSFVDLSASVSAGKNIIFGPVFWFLFTLFIYSTEVKVSNPNWQDLISSIKVAL